MAINLWQPALLLARTVARLLSASKALLRKFAQCGRAETRWHESRVRRAGGGIFLS